MNGKWEREGARHLQGSGEPFAALSRTSGFRLLPPSLPTAVVDRHSIGAAGC